MNAHRQRVPQEGHTQEGGSLPALGSQESVPDYNVAELSGEHIIMVLLGEGEVHYNVCTPSIACNHRGDIIMRCCGICGATLQNCYMDTSWYRQQACDPKFSKTP